MAATAVLTPEREKTEMVHYGEMPPNCHAEQYELHDAYIIDMHAVARELERYQAQYTTDKKLDELQ